METLTSRYSCHCPCGFCPFLARTGLGGTHKVGCLFPAHECTYAQCGLERDCRDYCGCPPSGSRLPFSGYALGCGFSAFGLAVFGFTPLACGCVATFGADARTGFGWPPAAPGPVLVRCWNAAAGCGGRVAAPWARTTPGALNAAGLGVAAMAGRPPLAFANSAGFLPASWTCCRCIKVGRTCGSLCGGTLRRSRCGSSASGTAVVAHLTDPSIANDRLIVSVMYDCHVDIRHGLIVGKGVADPAPAGETHADISEAVIDSTVEADVRAPIASVKCIHPADKAPIARSPEQAKAWRAYPGARHPVIATGRVTPVARRPQIPFFRTRGLFVAR